MGAIKRIIARNRRRLAAMSRPVWLAAAMLALLVLVGVIWLCSIGFATRRPQLTESIEVRDLAAAEAALKSRGIAYRTEGRALFVSPPSVAQAKAILGEQPSAEGDRGSPFEQLSRDVDIWRTESQNDKRWQAAKMATLGRLIAMIPPVESATVIYEQGAPRRLGSAGTESTAAVKVTLKDGAKMTPKLSGAIADLVAGSIAGMNRQNVRIIDNTGESFRAGENSVPSPDGGGVEELRAAEAYYVEKIQSALHYAGNVAVGVHVERVGGQCRCLSAAVSVPRSYLMGVFKAAGGGADPGDEEQFQQQAARQLDKVRQAVSKVIGASSPDSVNVDWHFDLSPVAGAPAEEPTANAGFRGSFATAGWIGVAMAGAGVVALIGAVLLHRRLTKSSGLGTANESPRALDGVAAAGPPAHAGVSDFFQSVSTSDLLALVANEHPQTIAMVLLQLSRARAATVLAGLPPARQADVLCRIAAIEQVDPEVIREVEHSLAARACAADPSRRHFGGAGAAAEILQQAGLATEQAAMRELASREPAMAEFIRTRLFAFDDIVHMPAPLLREAMETLDECELAVALRTAGEEVKHKVMSSLPAGEARRLRHEMQRIGPVRLSDVEAAQQRVVEAVRRVEDGRFVSARGEVLA